MKIKIIKENYLNVISVWLVNLIFLVTFSSLNANPGGDDDFDKGITVSPSHIKFNVDIGKTTTKKVKVSNHTGNIQKFRVNYNDFDIGLDGKSSFLESGTSKYSLSKFINISPTFLEIDPGSFEEVTITVTVPSTPEGHKAAWGVLLIEQMEEKKALDPGNSSGNTVAFGITPTYAFGVWLYQNPPHVENMSVDITNFKYDKNETTNLIYMHVENLGDGISFCNAYVELTNLETGEQQVLDGKRYTILPGYKRTLVFDLTPDLVSGKYSAVGVLDYNSDEELVAAELEFTAE